MRVKIESQMRKLFSQLDSELQKLLLADLGFLTLGTEEEQLIYIKSILSMDSVKIKKIKFKLAEWHKTDEYKSLFLKFEKEFKDEVIPAVNIAQKKENNAKDDLEKYMADVLVEKSLSEIDD